MSMILKIKEMQLKFSSPVNYFILRCHKIIFNTYNNFDFSCFFSCVIQIFNFYSKIDKIFVYKLIAKNIVSKHTQIKLLFTLTVFVIFFFFFFFFFLSNDFNTVCIFTFIQILNNLIEKYL